MKTNLSVIGLQWGDEGKGKIVDYLSEYVDVVVRFQGGNNAGHTLVVDGKTYKLNLLPSGIVREDVLCILDQGVVVDLQSLAKEIENVSFKPEQLMISENCHIILSLHQELDVLYESLSSSSSAVKIGTTGKGIGPCYEDKVGRRGIRICDVYSDNFTERLVSLLAHHNALRVGLGGVPVELVELKESIKNSVDKVAPYVVSSKKVMDVLDSKHILYEGAQGCLLDINYGTYPFVTSSSTLKPSYTPNDNFVVGVAKAYMTRVGNGPFPTEQENEIGEYLQQKGREIGTVTSRKRRCGWFDAVLGKHAIKMSGVHGIALTKLDVLDGLKEIKVCVGYKSDNKQYDYLPSQADLLSMLSPVYESFPGWDEVTEGMRNKADLPVNAVRYIRRLEELLGVSIVFLSTGPKREDIIDLV